MQMKLNTRKKGQQRLRSALAFTQSDQGYHCQLTESTNIEYFNKDHLVQHAHMCSISGPSLGIKALFSHSASNDISVIVELS